MTYDAAAFAAEYALTNAQRAAAEAFAQLLLETQAHTNLIGPATVPDLWHRHFADSAQLLPLGQPGRWLDIGSGGGFPGIVLAILGAEVTLVEARQKKAAFLARAVEALGLGPTARVHAVRVEALPRFAAANITARALAPLAQVFDWGLPFAAQSARFILPKGAGVAGELEAARRAWRFRHRLIPSRTAAEGRIVIAEGVKPAG